jgi:selenide,water dikinase
LGPGDLSKVLKDIPLQTDPRLLVGRESFDDAGVFLVAPDLALVQTVDFFPPIVDDPYTFGQIAAANAMSDVYAMGGQPLTALSIVGFPTNDLPLSVLTDILRGGQDKVHEAGAHIVGGHSVVDTELKYGLSVTGKAHPDFLLTNKNAKAGDVLVLTKPIGTGALTTAAKKGIIQSDALKPAIDAMLTLNGNASRAALAVNSRCATDVTGFGLLGHALHIARASAVTIQFESSKIPTLPGALEAVRAGAVPDGAKRNREFASEFLRWDGVSEEMKHLLVDPQTSGGLLVAISHDRVDKFLSRVDGATVVGNVLAKSDVFLYVV